MRIDNISDNNFQGKIILSKTLSKKKQAFAERLINYGCGGVTNEEYLKRKNFDVCILNGSTKKSSHSKLNFHIGLKYIGTEGSDRGVDITNIKADSVRLDEGLWRATVTLRNLIDQADAYADDYLPTQYNSGFQKALIKIAMSLGIL